MEHPFSQNWRRRSVKGSLSCYLDIPIRKCDYLALFESCDMLSHAAEKMLLPPAERRRAAAAAAAVPASAFRSTVLPSSRKITLTALLQREKYTCLI